jgi:hypothetical protein
MQPDGLYELSDSELAAALATGLASNGRLPRHADLFLATICAEGLVDRLRAEGLVVVVKRPAKRPHESCAGRRLFP